MTRDRSIVEARPPQETVIYDEGWEGARALWEMRRTRQILDQARATRTRPETDRRLCTSEMATNKGTLCMWSLQRDRTTTKETESTETTTL